MLVGFRQWLVENLSAPELGPEEIRTMLDLGLMSLKEWLELVIGEEIKETKLLLNDTHLKFYRIGDPTSRLYVIVKRGAEVQLLKTGVIMQVGRGNRPEVIGNHRSEWIPLERFNRAHFEEFRKL